jgi:hypothetical protein
MLRRLHDYLPKRTNCQIAAEVNMAVWLLDLWDWELGLGQRSAKSISDLMVVSHTQTRPLRVRGRSTGWQEGNLENLSGSPCSSPPSKPHATFILHLTSRAMRTHIKGPGVTLA